MSDHFRPLAPISSNIRAYRKPTTVASSEDGKPLSDPNFLPKKISSLKIQAKTQKKRPSNLCATPPGSLRDKHGASLYFRGKCIGEGGFARCFVVSDINNAQYAAKVTAKKSLTSEKAKTKLFGEIRLQQSMNHPNIVGYRDCFEDDDNIYLILEFCSNGSFMELLSARKTMTEPEVRLIMLQILSAVKYMHSQRVIHRDLKLGNLLLDSQMKIKIGDFGLAAILISEDERKMTICGTPNYIAPEILFGKSNGHSFEVDLWSTGIIMYALLLGVPPFQEREVKTIYKRIENRDLKFPENCSISYEAKDLINQLLDFDPNKRPSIDQIILHPFFRSGPIFTELPLSAMHSVPDPPVFVNQAIQERRIQTILNKCHFFAAPALSAKDLKTKVPMYYLQPQTRDPVMLPETLTPRDRPRPIMKTLASKPASFSNKLQAHLANAQDNQEERSFVGPDLNQLTQRALTIVGNLLGYNKQKFSRGHLLPNASNRYPFITKWVDYSNKYGVGFELADATTGVCFRDNTKLLLDSDGETFRYLQPSKSNPASMRITLFHSADRNPQLERKVYLLYSFQKFMNEHLSTIKKPAKRNLMDNSSVTFLHKFVRKPEATIFQLNCGAFQMNCADHRKISVFPNEDVIQYIDENKKIHAWSIEEARENLAIDGLTDKLHLLFESMQTWQSAEA